MKGSKYTNEFLARLAQHYATFGRERVIVDFKLTHGQFRHCLDYCRERGIEVPQRSQNQAMRNDERRRRDNERHRIRRGHPKRRDGWTDEQIAVFERIFDDAEGQKAERIAQETGRGIHAIRNRITEYRTFGDPRRLTEFRKTITRGGNIDYTGLLERFALRVPRRPEAA